MPKAIQLILGGVRLGSLDLRCSHSLPAGAYSRDLRLGMGEKADRRVLGIRLW